MEPIVAWLDSPESTTITTVIDNHNVIKVRLTQSTKPTHTLESEYS